MFLKNFFSAINVERYSQCFLTGLVSNERYCNAAQNYLCTMQSYLRQICPCKPPRVPITEKKVFWPVFEILGPQVAKSTNKNSYICPKLQIALSFVCSQTFLPFFILGEFLRNQNLKNNANLYSIWKFSTIGSRNLIKTDQNAFSFSIPNRRGSLG